ncbi:unnamed protein product [Darwinula stevensoni]|uniref:Uncharacterized protein n=1 Tax=Darwinula stevensoni TaxID=69355 RepID=A0A7R9A414_9CRUS|nr:unnamed protein product [Darwinula stevensoni]CAG0892713.1 unnamed protein product [Darwinula stevensoni]
MLRNTKKVNYFRHNERFMNNQKLFYRELGAKPIEVKKIPGKAEVEEFWSNIMERPASHNVDATWLRRTTGVVLKDLKGHVRKLECEISLDILQRTAILGTASILRRVLQN